jgi:hypothetical protein
MIAAVRSVMKAPASSWLLLLASALCLAEHACAPPRPAPTASVSSSGQRRPPRRRRRERFPARAPLPLVVTLQAREVREVSVKLRERFVGSDWRKVQRAAAKIESADRAGASALLAMLRRNRRVRLSNTDGLIYPGAARPSAEGRVIQYELDWTADRVGWVLEALTFEDFGFASDSTDGVAREGVAAQRRARAVRSARSWWRERRARWSRLDAVRDALAGNVDRQRRVLHWLRFGTTPCKGFDVPFFYGEVVPQLRAIYERTRDREVRELAAELLGRGAE